jgi:hypothetical protein
LNGCPRNDAPRRTPGHHRIRGWWVSQCWNDRLNAVPWDDRSKAVFRDAIVALVKGLVQSSFVPCTTSSTDTNQDRGQAYAHSFKPGCKQQIANDAGPDGGEDYQSEWPVQMEWEQQRKDDHCAQGDQRNLQSNPQGGHRNRGRPDPASDARVRSNGKDRRPKSYSRPPTRSRLSLTICMPHLASFCIDCFNSG